MDVTKKIELMRVMESYWTMLPPEIHEFILLFKKNQETFEEEKERKLKAVGKEIVMYHELKEKWGIGHVKCYVKKESCFNCDRHHVIVVGCYVDVENVEREAFLAFDLKIALQRVNHVKSFM